MSQLTSQLVRWGLFRKPLRTVFLLLTVVGALASFASTEAVMRDLYEKTLVTWRTFQYDISARGPKAHSVSAEIAALKGVRKVEKTILFPAVIGVSQVEIAVADEKSELLPIALASGRLPSNENEIVISENVAMLTALGIGDEIGLTVLTDLDQVVTFTITGMEKGITNFVSATGADRIQPYLPDFYTLLIALDGTVPTATIERIIRQMPEATWVKSNDERAMYEGTTSIAEALVLLTRALLLAVGVVSLYMLFYLGQQERSYELGVLRALGFSRRKVTTTLLLEGLFILAAGSLLALLLVLVISFALGLGSWNIVIARYIPGSCIVLGLGLLAVLWTSWKFASRPITTLFKG